jgi:hypothetical protein
MARRITRSTLLLAAVAAVGLGLLALFGYQFVQMGFHKGPDHMFGDQHLKTTVALLELHRVRSGSYPRRVE